MIQIQCPQQLAIQMIVILVQIMPIAGDTEFDPPLDSECSRIHLLLVHSFEARLHSCGASECPDPIFRGQSLVLQLMNVFLLSLELNASQR